MNHILIFVYNAIHHNDPCRWGFIGNDVLKIRKIIEFKSS